MDRNQAGIQEARAKTSGSETRLTAAVRGVEREVEAANTSLQNATSVLALYKADIIPQLEENLKLTQEAYRLGETGILAVIQEQKKFIEINEGYLAALHTRQTAFARLETVVAAGACRRNEMKKKTIVSALILAVVAAATGGGIYYRAFRSNGDTGQAEQTTTVRKEQKNDTSNGGDEHGGEGRVSMSADIRNQNGVVIGQAKKQQLAGVISATGKIEANADNNRPCVPPHLRQNRDGQILPGRRGRRRPDLGDSGQRRAW